MEERLKAEFWTYWLTSTNDIIFLKNIEGKYLAVSKAAANFAGYDNVEDVIGKTDHDILSKDTANYFSTLSKKILETKESITEEIWVRSPKKGYVLCEVHVSPICDNNNKIIAIRGFLRDITEKHMLNKKIEEQHAQLLAILRNIPFPMWIKDVSGNIVMLNKQYEEFYNSDSLEILGKSENDMLKKRKIIDRKNARKLIIEDEKVYYRKTTIRDEVYMRLNQQEKLIEIIKAPILSEKGEITGLVALSRDITNLRNYEKRLIDAKRLADKANKAKSEFLARMSHEIRTPMNGILGFLQLLADTTLDEEQEDYVSEIKKSTEILLALINDILDLSKIEAGKVTLENISFNIRYLLEDVGALAASAASGKGVEVNVLCYSDIPERIIGDSSRLKQVLNNFLNNAVKFTQSGEINLTVKLLEENSDNNKIKLQFEIQDTGIGIAKNAQKKIFNSFSQADNSISQKYGGTGLGLAIAKDIIELMNGKVSLKSEENKGCKFTFDAEFEIDKENEHYNSNPSNEILKGKSILLVDDNKTNLKVVEHYLKEFSCYTTKANSPSQALDFIAKRKTPFNVILTDYCMPEMNGIEFAKEIKKINKYDKVPIILLSSKTQLASCKSIKDSNLSGYLPKPIKKNDLIDSIKFVLDHNNMSKKKIKDEPFTVQTLKEIRQECKLKILLVEDNLMNQKLITKMLQKLGYSCDIANNGKEAVDAFNNDPSYYDIIFMDCQMPIMNGFEATENIRKIEEKTKTHIPIIAFTANAMKSDIKKCYSYGMDDYLAKPIKQEFLISKLSHYTEQKMEKEDYSDNTERENNVVNAELSDIIKIVCSDLGIDENDANELLTDFCNECSESFIKLEEQILAEDYDAVYHTAHTIKGAAGNLRIDRIQELAKEIEMNGRNGSVKGSIELLGLMKDYISKIFEI